MYMLANATSATSAYQLLYKVTYQRTVFSVSPPWSLWCPISEFFTLFRLWKPLRHWNISRNPTPVFEFATQPQ